MTDSYERELGKIGEAIVNLTGAVTALKEGQSKNTSRLATIEKALCERKGAERVLVWLAGTTGAVGVALGVFGKSVVKFLES
jgi:hypothetical protein